MKHRLSLVAALACVFCLAAGMLGCTSQEYTPKELTPTVSTPTIGQAGTLRVGVDADGGAPFTATSSSGEDVGFDVDMAAAIADQLGLKLEIVEISTDAATALANDECDIVMSQSASAESTAMWVSDPYIETGVALFAASGTAVPSRDSAPQIAAQSSSTSAWAVENSFGDDAIVASSDLMAAFSSVENGKAKYVAADAVIGTYAAQRQSVDVEAIAVLGSVGGYCVGVSASNTDLQSAISDALSTILSNGVADVVCEKWLGTTLNLSALPTVEVSASSSSSSDETSSETASTSTAGANAVVQGSTTTGTDETATSVDGTGDGYDVVPEAPAADSAADAA